METSPPYDASKYLDYFGYLMIPAHKIFHLTTNQSLISVTDLQKKDHREVLSKTKVGDKRYNTKQDKIPKSAGANIPGHNRPPGNLTTRGGRGSSWKTPNLK